MSFPSGVAFNSSNTKASWILSIPLPSTGVLAFSPPNNFGYKKPGDKINLENDMVGKYIDKLLHFDQQETNDKHTNSTLTMEMLRNAGF